MRSYSVFLTGLFLAFLFVQKTQAADACLSAMKTYQDIIACAEARSPDIQKALLDVEHSKTSIEAAGQWENPELSAETFQGKKDGQQQKETDISLNFPIQLGSKISARQNVAKSALNLAEAKLYEAKAAVRSQVFLKLHRLRQIMHEQELANDAIRTFTRLIDQYAKRPSLSPEQRISFSVYQLSQSEYELKKATSVAETLALSAFFKLTLGLTAEQIRPMLPSDFKTWPKLSLPENNKNISPKRQILQAELDTAKAELSLAQSESWPTLTLGPSLKMQTEDGKSNNFIGFNISLPLPLFNLNGGVKTAAVVNVRRHESFQNSGILEQEIRREELLQVYEHSVKTMKEILSHENIERKRRDAERLFIRGVAPSSLVIEAHRTSFELEKARHEHEMRTLELLLAIYTIDGNILEVSL